MALYDVASSKTTAATANVLIAQLRTSATRNARIYEIGVTIASAAGNTVRLNRPTAVGATFTSVVPQAEDIVSGAPTTNLDTAATTPPTAASVDMRRMALPATVGAGVIWTWGKGLFVPISSAIALFQSAATAVTYEVYFVYEED